MAGCVGLHGNRISNHGHADGLWSCELPVFQTGDRCCALTQWIEEEHDICKEGEASGVAAWMLAWVLVIWPDGAAAGMHGDPHFLPM